MQSLLLDAQLFLQPHLTLRTEHMQLYKPFLQH